MVNFDLERNVKMKVIIKYKYVARVGTKYLI